MLLCTNFSRENLEFLEAKNFSNSTKLLSLYLVFVIPNSLIFFILTFLHTVHPIFLVLVPTL